MKRLESLKKLEEACDYIKSDELLQIIIDTENNGYCLIDKILDGIVKETVPPE